MSQFYTFTQIHYVINKIESDEGVPCERIPEGMPSVFLHGDTVRNGSPFSNVTKPAMMVAPVHLPEVCLDCGLIELWNKFPVCHRVRLYPSCGLRRQAGQVSEHRAQFSF